MCRKFYFILQDWPRRGIDIHRLQLRVGAIEVARGPSGFESIYLPFDGPREIRLDIVTHSFEVGEVVRVGLRIHLNFAPSAIVCRLRLHRCTVAHCANST